MNSKKLKSFLETHKPYKCEKCDNIGEWNSKPLRLQVDHIDGNSSNNDLTNLRFLCPNCHSQTDTFTGRNAKSKNFVAPTRDEFLELLKTYSVKEISILKAVSLRVVYQWFKMYVKEKRIRNIATYRKLTCMQIQEILSSPIKSETISRTYGVSGKTIRSIRRREVYTDCN